MSAALFVLFLLASFNRTMNRLTKPVSAFIGLSLLSSAFLSFYYYFNKIEGELILSNYLKIFEKTNLIIHLNTLSEKFLIVFSLIMTILIGLLFYKLPRKTRLRFIDDNYWSAFFIRNVFNIVARFFKSN